MIICAVAIVTNTMTTPAATTSFICCPYLALTRRSRVGSSRSPAHPGQSARCAPPARLDERAPPSRRAPAAPRGCAPPRARLRPPPDRQSLPPRNPTHGGHHRGAITLVACPYGVLLVANLR